MINVNQHEAEPGCYIAGHHGQYAMDQLGDLVESFDIELNRYDDPRFWRGEYDEATGQHDADKAFEQLVYASDKCEELLNRHTAGGSWSWDGGEFFLTRTTIELEIQVFADDRDEAFEILCDKGLDAVYTGAHGDLADDGSLHTFDITIHRGEWT